MQIEQRVSGDVTIDAINGQDPETSRKRPEFTKLTRVVTIDDPGAFTRPFDVRFTAELGSPDSEILEYICIENNQYGLPGGYDYNPVGK